MSRTIEILDGDQTGQELLEESLRVLHSDGIRYPLEFLRFDLSLANRRATQNHFAYEAVKARYDPQRRLPGLYEKCVLRQ